MDEMDRSLEEVIQAEQSEKAGEALGAMIAGYYQSLIAGGVPEDTVIWLVDAYQKFWLNFLTRAQPRPPQ